VLFFSALSFSGWIARRFVGAEHGIIVSGLLGGTLSSTSVTLQFARASRAADAPRLALAAGAAGACTVMLLRVVVAALVLSPALAIGVLPHVLLAFAVGAAVVLLAWRGNPEPAARLQESRSPLDLRSALQMAGLFQAVLLVIALVQERWGTGALVPASMFVALTDLDALTLSLARTSTVGPAPAAVALAAGIISNTILKLGVALVVGRGVFRLVTGTALGLMGLATAIGLLMH